MSTPFRAFCAGVEDVARDIARASRRLAHAIAVMPWPALLVCCLGLALVISVLPLALFLFLAFLALKLVAGAFLIEARGKRRARAGH